ncbi:MAG: ABC transporter permease [Myxococcota bacterium]|jgi:putative ABC transport system permease protein|nr:ABC transporter permease [Myxococcota bacterium]
MMSGRDIVGFAANALLEHRRRTLLSLLGVAMGATAVVFLTGLGEGARLFVRGEFETLGSNLVVVLPGKNETAGALPGVGGVPNDLTIEDARALSRELRGARAVIPISTGTDLVSFRERRRQVAIVGTTRKFFDAMNLRVARGSFLPTAELGRGSSVAVLGNKAARELFQDRDPIGEVVRVGDARMRVIGVLASRGTQMGQNIDDMLFAPATTVMQLFNRSSLRRIMVQLNAYADADAMVEQIIAIMTERHDEEDVTCITQAAVMESLGGILRALTLAVGGIAAISLAVAGIGIMNVMLVSVSERTSEIGLLKAVGARGRDILAVFLIESALLSAMGGVLGLALGRSLLLLVSYLYPKVPATTPLWIVLSVLAMAISTGPLFGVIPAWRAMQLEPVASLRKG